LPQRSEEFCPLYGRIIRRPGVRRNILRRIAAVALPCEATVLPTKTSEPVYYLARRPGIFVVPWLGHMNKSFREENL
jgi:hypothetical protein